MEDLAQWLSVVEIGLSSILDKAAEHTIEEEQEQDDTAERHGPADSALASSISNDTSTSPSALVAE